MREHEAGQPSRWILRAMEWDEERARYPNLWREGMPCHVLGQSRLVSRMRLGDLVVVFYPPSTRHAERSERFVGLSRVTGLRLADDPGNAWIDLATEHRFRPPLDLGEPPRRVSMCCDRGWPEADVALFERVLEAASAAGWRPPEPRVPRDVPARELPRSEGPQAAPRVPRAPEVVERRERAPAPEPDVLHGRGFAGADLGGDMRDQRDGTWLAVLDLHDERLRIVRLDPTGRSGLQSALRDPDRILMRAEAIGLTFPFGLPLPFAERLLGGEFPAEGWWGLVRKLERLSRPDYLAALQEFRDAQGEIKRLTDERSETFSPLHRASPDLGPLTYHGVRMIAEDRSRYAIRPFESAQGRLLLEVNPEGMLRKLGLTAGEAVNGRQATLAGLAALDRWPIDVTERHRPQCLGNRHALDAVLAARGAAVAVLTGEADMKPEELAPEAAERVRREGWIYGLG